MQSSESATPLYRNILVPTDGSEPAGRAVAAAIGIARALGARLHIVSVLERFTTLGDRSHAFAGLPPSMRQQALDALDANARATLDHARAAARNAAIELHTSTVEADDVAAAIVEVARACGADLIVMGSHGRRGIAALVLGSVTQKVLTHCATPVLVVR